MSRAPLLVSLAVISDRLPALDYVLVTLLEQTLRPDKVMLAISPEPYLLDKGVRPDDLPPLTRREIAAGRVELMVVPNTGPYRKLLPTLERLAGTPGWVATADDDVLYPPRWLEGLVRAAGPAAAIACYRARIAGATATGMTPYETWPLVHRDTAVDPAGGLGVFPTGRGGVLYPTLAFPDAAVMETLSALAPAQDDLAFRVATLLGGVPAIPVSPAAAGSRHWEFPPAMGPSPNLYDGVNAGGANDKALARLVAAVRGIVDIPALLRSAKAGTGKAGTGRSSAAVA